MSTIRALGFTDRMTPFMMPAKGSLSPKSVVRVMIEFGMKANAHRLLLTAKQKANHRDTEARRMHRLNEVGGESKVRFR
jgi:hypothetical protein